MGNSPKLYIVDDYSDLPKWAKNLELPRDNQTLYIYGVEGRYFYTYMPLTADVAFVEEQLEYRYKAETEGLGEVKDVSRWRKK